jgi:radical SAM superfamily enzyme YgiQ (UPF0313 family)
MVDIVLLNPRFDASFWGLEYVLPLIRKRAAMPVASLPLLAALTPSGHTVTIIDENVEPIDYGRLARADIVGITGMSVQRRRMREILAEVRKLRAFVVVGGPWVTVQEDYFGDLADTIFVGEAEETWALFLEEWGSGNPRKRYEQADKTDMSQVPLPRYDLLKMRHYLFGSVQFSRGCPFQCDFCDIIVTFGRRPRFKTADQILLELDALLAQRMEVVFIVDDNFVGNRVAVKKLLPDVIAWQQRHGFPIIFVTEASLDLAEEPELIRLMTAANIQSVFVGIESPNEESLKNAKKYQNVRRNTTVLDRVLAIEEAGLEVWCGMIVGFDQDSGEMFDAQLEFISRARIIEAMVGMLYAIPKTPLHHRLASEGRLDPEDVPAFGTNVIPLKMSREELRDGYIRLMTELYSPENYFGRLDGLLLRGHFQLASGQARYWQAHRWVALKGKTRLLLRAAYLFVRLMVSIPDPKLRREYRCRVLGLMRVRRDPPVVFGYILKCAMHYHHHRMAQDLAGGRIAVVNPY